MQGWPSPRPESAICGIGPVQAAAETALRLAHARPQRVVLAGLAGTYDGARAPLGCVLPVAQTRLVGVGVGCSGKNHESADAGGLPRHPNDPRTEDSSDLGPPTEGGHLALTVCAASRNRREARQRARVHRDAIIEEMEGFAVAWVARRKRLAFEHWRAVSNVAGVRDRARWCTEDAFSELSAVLLGRCEMTTL